MFENSKSSEISENSENFPFCIFPFCQNSSKKHFSENVPKKSCKIHRIDNYSHINILLEIFLLLRSYKVINSYKIEKLRNYNQCCQLAEFTANFRKVGGIWMPLAVKIFGGGNWRNCKKLAEFRKQWRNLDKIHLQLAEFNKKQFFGKF